MINYFDGQYRWLSNFWPCQVLLEGEEYPSVEHAYQAAKTVVDTERERIRAAATPGKAKRLGSKVGLRYGWSVYRVDIMTELVRQKFGQPEMRAKLLTTGDELLVEGNSWHDGFWGSCTCGKCCIGQNVLGQILMRVRNEIRKMYEECKNG